MMRMPMVNMAKTPTEVKSDIASMNEPKAVGKPSVPEYPYGLSISLDSETLKKLKIDGDLPNVGETIHGSFIARVTSASINERVGDGGAAGQDSRIELQITDMGILSADPADALRTT